MKNNKGVKLIGLFLFFSCLTGCVQQGKAEESTIQLSNKEQYQKIETSYLEEYINHNDLKVDNKNLEVVLKKLEKDPKAMNWSSTDSKIPFWLFVSMENNEEELVIKRPSEIINEQAKARNVVLKSQTLKSK